MKLNVYKNQREILKTVEADAYDLMYGTIEDILDILDGVGTDNNDAIVKAVVEKRDALNELILDVFPDLERDDLRNIKIKELIPMFIELFTEVGKAFGDRKN